MFVNKKANSYQSFKVVESGHITSPKGYSAGGLHCGIKRKRPDLGWLVSEVPAHAAGVYTTNLFQAAPLVVTQESLAKENKLQAIIINSGNANACTGEQGLKDAYDMQQAFSQKLGMASHLIGVASTGVIGERLPIDKIKLGIASIPEVNGQAETFEKAILTTDKMTKHVAVKVDINGREVTIAGAAKGSGMIHPNMATMLGFITTDAHIDHAELSQLLKDVTNKTYNMITVDGDTSTNDMVLVLANGMANNTLLTKNHQDWNNFKEAFTYVSETLAKMIARDGEGATKLIEVKVSGAKSELMAKKISKSVIGSSLVKTAVFGADPNWGRIICAVGYSGEPINVNCVSVALGDITVVKNGLPIPFSEDEAFNYLNQDTIQIVVDLGDGKEEAVAWGCDLTYDYVQINASYRT